MSSRDSRQCTRKHLSQVFRQCDVYLFCPSSDSENVERRTHIPQTLNSMSVHTESTSVKGKHQRRILTTLTLRYFTWCVVCVCVCMCTWAISLQTHIHTHGMTHTHAHAHAHKHTYSLTHSAHKLKTLFLSLSLSPSPSGLLMYMIRKVGMSS